MDKKIKVKNPAPDSIELWLAEIAMAYKASEKFMQSAARVPNREIPDLLPWQLAPLFALGARGLDRHEKLLDEAAGYAFSSFEQYFPVSEAVPAPPPAVAFAFCYVGAHLGLDLVSEEEADQVLDTIEANEDTLESMIDKAEAILKQNNPFDMFMLGIPSGAGNAGEKTDKAGEKQTAEKKTGTQNDIFVLEVSLENVKPRIWRRLAVPGHITLAQLHQVIQVVMGWSDSHLHQFKIGQHAYVSPDSGLDLDWAEGKRDESEVRLSDVAGTEGVKFQYTYDFGDDWRHKLEVKKIEPPQPGMQYPRCLAGKRSAPPEDCGGASGYWEISTPEEDSNESDEYLAEMRKNFDPEAFDIDKINARLKKLR